MKKLLILGLLIANSWNLFAIDYLPSNLIQLDSKFSHHVILVEKSTHKLFLYEAGEEKPKLIKTYDIATGKIKGNKRYQGDHKTPEGIYVFQNFHSDKELLDKYGDYAKIYGAGAFTTNYPNEIDKRAGKTGGGIWLHSTDDDSRVSKGLDSRGCVVAVDSDLKEISKYIDLDNTPIVIVQNINYLQEETWSENKREIVSSIDTWMKAWQAKDFENYIGSYSKNFFSASKGGLSQYKAYKRAVFARKDTPQINFRNISILRFTDYAIVTLEQEYISDIINDIGKKTLYLERDENYDWKISAELWQKLDATARNLAFTPSLRFFSNGSTIDDDDKLKKN